MHKLMKIDSFMGESQRGNGINSRTFDTPLLKKSRQLTGVFLVSLTRKSIKDEDMTLSDGKFLPAGTMLSAPSLQTRWHMDPANYTDPEVFNPWRFSEMRGQDGETLRHQLV